MLETLLEGYDDWEVAGADAGGLIRPGGAVLRHTGDRQVLPSKEVRELMWTALEYRVHAVDTGNGLVQFAEARR